jgi:hypothetical protein
VIRAMTVQCDTYSIHTTSSRARLLFYDNRLDDPNMIALLSDAAVDGRAVNVATATYVLNDSAKSSLLILLWPPQEVTELFQFKLHFRKRAFCEPRQIQVRAQN